MTIVKWGAALFGIYALASTDFSSGELWPTVAPFAAVLCFVVFATARNLKRFREDPVKFNQDVEKLKERRREENLTSDLYGGE